MAFSLSSFESAGLKLRYSLYQKEGAKKIKKYVFFLPGRSEFIEKYDILTKKLHLDLETALVVLDHRGQGASEGHPFHISSYDEFCQDIKALIKKIVPKEANYSMVGNSMGGLILIYGVLKEFFSPSKAFLTCPFLGLPKSSLWHLGAFALSGFQSSVGRGKKRLKDYKVADTFEENLLTGSREHYDFLKASPFPPEEGSFSWIFATLKAFVYLRKQSDLSKLKMPLVFCIARDEKIVSNPAIYRFIKKLQKVSSNPSVSRVSLHSFETKHEIFFDTEKETEKLFKLLNGWLLENNS